MARPQQRRRIRRPPAVAPAHTGATHARCSGGPAPRCTQRPPEPVPRGLLHTTAHTARQRAASAASTTLPPERIATSSPTGNGKGGGSGLSAAGHGQPHQPPCQRRVSGAPGPRAAHKCSAATTSSAPAHLPPRMPPTHRRRRPWARVMYSARLRLRCAGTRLGPCKWGTGGLRRSRYDRSRCHHARHDISAKYRHRRLDVRAEYRCSRSRVRLRRKRIRENERTRERDNERKR